MRFRKKNSFIVILLETASIDPEDLEFYFNLCKSCGIYTKGAAKDYPLTIT